MNSDKNGHISDKICHLRKERRHVDSGNQSGNLPSMSVCLAI